MSKLVLTVGCMFAGKSTALIAQGVKHDLAGQKIVYVKPQLDNRYSENEIVTHDKLSVTAVAVSNDDSLLSIPDVANADVILIDEIQFFTEKFINEIDSIVTAGKTVYCSGLDTDFQAVPFPVTAHIMAIADEVTKLKAVCSDCGKEAGFSARTVANGDRVLLGSKDMYKPVCRACHKKYTKQVK